MVGNGVENEVHSALMQIVAKLFQAVGSAKIGIEFLSPGAHCKPSTWHKKETVYSPVTGFALGSRALEIGKQVRPIRCRIPRFGYSGDDSLSRSTNHYSLCTHEHRRRMPCH